MGPHVILERILRVGVSTNDLIFSRFLISLNSMPDELTVSMSDSSMQTAITHSISLSIISYKSLEVAITFDSNLIAGLVTGPVRGFFLRQMQLIAQQPKCLVLK